MNERVERTQRNPVLSQARRTAKTKTNWYFLVLGANLLYLGFSNIGRRMLFLSFSRKVIATKQGNLTEMENKS